MANNDRLAKLVAVFDQFYDAIAQFDDPVAKCLAEGWSGSRQQCVAPAGAPRSVVAAGMEQGYRELPLLIQSMSTEVRRSAAEALAAATAAHYPDGLAKDLVRLEKIKTRGSIRGDSEFYLVRHHIDLLEGVLGREEDLHHLYALVDEFESRRT